jgi:integrase
VISSEVAVRVRLFQEANMIREKWVKRWDTWIAPRPSRPGVWRTKEGGYLIRGRAKDPRTGKLRQAKKRVNEVDAVGAYRLLQAELEQIRSGRTETEQTRLSFSDYAVSLLERKVAKGKIKSAKTRERWASTLENILFPWFGGYPMEDIRRATVLAWMDHAAMLIKQKRYKPSTANGWLGLLRVIINSYVFEHELERNPVLGVEDFDTREHPSYTEEEPNSLLPEEVPIFLAKMLELHPQHYAMVTLGFGTGLRPSSLRPLRRRGPTPDVLWDEGVLLIRRSHTRKQEVMETTKTGQHQRLKLPEELMEILRWHQDRLTEKRSRCDLLFPPRWGDGLMSASALDKPFQEVTAALKKEGKLKKQITPRAMRRTFQDLAREAQVKDIVTRAISGHATEQMQRHYSTVNAREVEESIGKVISLARAREILARGAEERSGTEGGTEARKDEKSASQGGNFSKSDGTAQGPSLRR